MKHPIAFYLPHLFPAICCPLLKAMLAEKIQDKKLKQIEESLVAHEIMHKDLQSGDFVVNLQSNAVS